MPITFFSVYLIYFLFKLLFKNVMHGLIMAYKDLTNCIIKLLNRSEREKVNIPSLTQIHVNCNNKNERKSERLDMKHKKWGQSECWTEGD